MSRQKNPPAVLPALRAFPARVRRRWLAPLAMVVLGSALLVSAGCSDSSEPGKVVDGVKDTGIGGNDVNPFQKDGQDSTSIIDINLGQTDAIEEVAINPGEFGYPCTSSTDCFSGLCLETANGKQCTTICTTTSNHAPSLSAVAASHPLSQAAGGA